MSDEKPFPLQVFFAILNFAIYSFWTCLENVFFSHTHDPRFAIIIWRGPISRKMEAAPITSLFHRTLFSLFPDTFFFYISSIMVIFFCNGTVPLYICMIISSSTHLHCQLITCTLFEVQVENTLTIVLVDFNH